METKKRRTLIRISLILLIILFSMFLYRIGKTHTLLLDNKAVTMEGVSFAALESVVVKAGRYDPVEIYPRERGMLTTKGPRQRITVEVYNKAGELSSSRIFRITTKEEMILISLPALVADHPQAISPFTPPGQ